MTTTLTTLKWSWINTVYCVIHLTLGADHWQRRNVKINFITYTDICLSNFLNYPESYTMKSLVTFSFCLYVVAPFVLHTCEMLTSIHLTTIKRLKLATTSKLNSSNCFCHSSKTSWIFFVWIFLTQQQPIQAYTSVYKRNLSRHIYKNMQPRLYHSQEKEHFIGLSSQFRSLCNSFSLSRHLNGGVNVMNVKLQYTRKHSCLSNEMSDNPKMVFLCLCYGLWVLYSGVLNSLYLSLTFWLNISYYFCLLYFQMPVCSLHYFLNFSFGNIIFFSFCLLFIYLIFLILLK